ncbi:strigolactone esterase D14-like [Juglans microcarpa x Juglans regia]|uniref:strigolactone esterase D14-like n=1 Tax=Juglans microcarpa x Juglans regia TaxID=2249226 RepID=UPI001B7EC131|nr:strigolactone esterase D14-like [Juglans microcarpa x Juglans regia]
MVLLENGIFSTAMNSKIIGSGSEVIVLAHGYGGDQSVWDKILPSLAQHCRVLVFDWTFSGAVEDPNLYDPVKYSSYDAFADDLISLLVEMNLQSSVFIGHSMSGLIGCIASIKRPELFKRLVLIGSSPRCINTDDYEGGFGNSDIDKIISNIESNYQNWTSAFASLVVDAKDPLSVDKFAKCLKRMRPEVALHLAKIVFQCDEREVLEKVIKPCTIIQTTKDYVVPNSVALYMLKKIKGKSTVEMIEGDGHFPQLTAHLQLLEVLGRVLGFDLIRD